MTHIYSDQLVAYLFNEIDPDTKKIVEAELTTNPELLAEFNDLKAGLGIILAHETLKPNPRIVQNILDNATSKESIPSD